MTKVTKKEMFAAIASYFADSDVVIGEGISAEQVVAFAEKEQENLAKKAAYAKSKAATKKVEGDALRDAVQAVLKTDEFQVIADIAAQIEGEDVTVAKVTNRLSNLVKAGIAESTEVTVGETGSKRRIKAYRLVAVDAE